MTTVYDPRMGKNRRRLAFGLAAAAVGWAVVLVASAFFFPAYAGRTCGTGGCTSTSSTLFAQNGWSVVELLLGVVAVAAIGLDALHVVCARGSDRAAKAATWCVALLGALAVVSAASVGLLVLPVAILLLASAMLTPQARTSK
jgi:hypothetical protein